MLLTLRSSLTLLQLNLDLLHHNYVMGHYCSVEENVVHTTSYSVATY